MSKFLPAHLANFYRDCVEQVPLAAAAQIGSTEVIDLCRSYRRLAIAILLYSCERDEFLGYLFRSGRLLAHQLPGVPTAEQVTSRLGGFFDAVAVRDFDTARAIAQAASTTRSPREYEEDFLFTRFLMDRFFLGMDDTAADQMLAQYATCLQGAADIRLEICRALHSEDADAFHNALSQYLDERETAYARKTVRESALPEEIATEGKLCVEGLALVVLAETLGMETERDYLFIPSLARADGPPNQPDDAWMDPG